MVTMIGICSAVHAEGIHAGEAVVPLEDIKSYCIDFNWATGRARGFAEPGTWAAADPAEHVAWYKQIGANVIQTFAVSCNGYAWYKDGVVPEQPGLKHDFLREMVKLGHAEGMLVMGYFCISANTRWGTENPNLSYGTPSKYHIPYTDDYLDYLSKAITDAVKATGIDGFMIDWFWMPRRLSTKGKWIEAEKELYEQLMGEAFPGEDQLTKEQDLLYSRKALDRCWDVIRKAAKDANPDCIIWLTVNKAHHPHVVDSDMYREVDWLMGEAGRLDEILKLKPMVGEHTRLITCMSDFGGPDAMRDVPEAIKAGVGLYGYAKPRGANGLIPLRFEKQLSELTGNDQRIAVLARAYRGMSLDAVWQDGKFVETVNPPPFRIRFRGRRGFSDTARLSFEGKRATIDVNSPYQSGRAVLTRVGDTWPDDIRVNILNRNPERDGATHFRVANGSVGARVVCQEDQVIVTTGEFQGKLEIGKPWSDKNFIDQDQSVSSSALATSKVEKTDAVLSVQLPAEIQSGNPGRIVFEWGKGDWVR
jgi:hypothetical protein